MVGVVAVLVLRHPQMVPVTPQFPSVTPRLCPLPLQGYAMAADFVAMVKSRLPIMV